MTIHQWTGGLPTRGGGGHDQGCRRRYSSKPKLSMEPSSSRVQWWIEVMNFQEGDDGAEAESAPVRVNQLRCMKRERRRQDKMPWVSWDTGYGTEF
jgi:hypothetical protein